MTALSLIPDSAPFNIEQRAWLNGFLAGWLGMQDGSATASPTLDIPETVEPDEPWHDPSMPIADRLAMAEGRPLADRLMASMAQLDCGACGYVCRSYADALAGGAETSASLCSPGGSETSKTVKRLLKAQGEMPVATSAAAPATVGWSRRNPFAASLIRSVRLNGEGSEKETRHVEIDLGGSGLDYKVGDALGVFPTNCEELVTSVVDALGARGDEPAGSSTLRQALIHDCCLTEISEPLLELMIRWANADDEAETLRRWIDGDGPPAGFDVLDVLRSFPGVRLDPALFVGSLSAMRPRLYSISSSPRKHAGQVHLTVGRVTSVVGGRVRKGVASTMLADRVDGGGTVRVFVQPSHGFTIPADPNAAMIMIGPGTGIAPFRAFLHEREAIGATGKNWLVFGDQREATDFLYRDELADLTRRGVLTRLQTAFSRDGDRKVYVQHRLRECGRDLYDWLQDGASIYVCGDARRMAVDVDRALREIVQEHGFMDEDSARNELARLAAAGRYCRDVY